MLKIAYHSYLTGRVAKLLNYSYVELHTSRGIETKEHKSFMRLTVLAADILIYMPAIIAISVCMDLTFEKNLKHHLLVLLAIYPGQILIDNGHFQYNNISLGFLALAVAALLCNRNNIAALTFTLALNYKQMELYHALPFFAYLLSVCFSQNSLRLFVTKLLMIATTVLATFFILWYPWLSSIDATAQVLYRLFPLGRGVFEDKVANFWCSINVIYKLKKHIVNHEMALICIGTTLLAVLPTNVQLFCRRSKYTFILTLFNTAAAFFLFSFQVHEKSILLILLPSICLFAWWPNEMLWFLKMSVFSMTPLLKKDNLVVPTLALMIIFQLIFMCSYFETNQNIMIRKNWIGLIIKISEILMISILFASLIIEPPARYPDIWPLIISIISCAHIFMFLVWGYVQQFT
ncbi:uncharacterized protein Dvir_GJ15406, isoform B [Drosophila virilis]|uniref:Alpha-1,3-glucosyltransferase n=1 Tax=Drosophila virilis TaxID=7244 RepID=A0A0Q9W8F3_DROVI|nr:probable dolichyl pyrophosphate Man9GlcNAc2 alpha-1,3-glucosyltransferase isoform X2 [Drosophila virilis]KRF78177.1 uncharacterized protein Dvir_GJ15406, isoform B [Drosophila virilis]